MARKRKPTPQTESGRVFAEESSGVVSSLAAHKAAATRRRNKVAERAQFKESVFAVYHWNEPVTYFSNDTTGEYSLDDVIAELTECFHGTDGAGYESKDMAVWKGDRIVAVLR